MYVQIESLGLDLNTSSSESEIGYRTGVIDLRLMHHASTRDGSVCVHRQELLRMAEWHNMYVCVGTINTERQQAARNLARLQLQRQCTGAFPYNP